MTDIYSTSPHRIRRIKMARQNVQGNHLSSTLEQFESTPICQHIYGRKSSKRQHIYSTGSQLERSILRHLSRFSRPARASTSAIRAPHTSRYMAAELIH